MRKSIKEVIRAMMAILLIGLFTSTITAQTTAQLKKLEYAFDTVPVIGNGISIDLPGVESLDSVFAFDVNSLFTGIHQLFYRVQDTAGKWSLTNRASFFKFPGTDASLAIDKLEYFTDVDPGAGNGIAIPVTPGNIISDTFNFTIPDNGRPFSTLYVRARDSRGVWSLLYTKEIDMCGLTKTVADFQFVRYGNRYAFTDSSRNNYEKKYRWDFGGLGIDTVSNPEFEFPRGNYKVTLITGEGCRKDTVEKTLYVTLESYYPNRAQRGGDVIMRFFGGSLDTNVTVELRKGNTALRPYKKASKDYKQLIGLFDLHTAEAGNYDVRLKYNDGFDTTIINGLFVDGNFVEPEIQVTLDGPEALRRSNQWTYYTLTVSNRGNSLAKGVPFWVTIPNNIEYMIDSKILAPPGYHGYPVTDSLPQYIPIDSLEGKPYVGRMYLMIAPYIDANESFQFKFRLRSTISAGEFALNYGSNESFWGSPLKYIWSDCFDNVLFLGLNVAGLTGAIPSGGVAEVITLGIDATAAIADLFIDNTVDVINGDFSPYSFMQSFGNAVLSATGFAAVKQMVTVGKVAKGAIAGGSLTSGGNSTVTGVVDCWQSQGKAKKILQKIGKVIIKIRNSFDPNQLTGPIGYGDDHYINGLGKMGYVIDFENLPTAGAPAQKVFITDTLDKTKYDLSSFELGSFRIADSTYKIPSQRKEYTTTVDLRPRLNLLLRFNAKLDTAKGILTYSFASLDPLSKGEIDEDALYGFLPPNTIAAHPAGNGTASFSVALKNSVNHNEVAGDRAAIVFDRNTPLFTNTWTNKIDKAEPTATVTGIRSRNDSIIVLHISGTDNGSGIQGYAILHSVNSGKMQYIGNAYADSAVLFGKYDSLYKFYVIPMDNVSNKGDSSTATIKLTATSLPLESGLTIFPNPGKDIFMIRLAVPEQQHVSIMLYSTTGQSIQTLFNSTASGRILLQPDLRKLNTGVYIVQVKGDKGLRLAGKLVVIQ